MRLIEEWIGQDTLIQVDATYTPGDATKCHLRDNTGPSPQVKDM